MSKDTRSKNGFDKEFIRELAGLLIETGLTEIEIERSGLKVRVARTLQVTSPVVAPAGAVEPAVAAAPAAPAEASPADDAKHPGAVRSPMVGTIYLSPEPSAAPFVEIGSQVTEGQTLLIIEAMKTMNHIPAPRSGTVARILCQNEQPVEFGEPLIIIE
ncbi:MAG: acetyl-CoA carboxylase biotin carboxyl carrier protein [Pseudomonadota bacterium]